jgi:hypothetical protein
MGCRSRAPARSSKWIVRPEEIHQSFVNSRIFVIPLDERRLMNYCLEYKRYFQDPSEITLLETVNA